jgi:hypothetical protein
MDFDTINALVGSMGTMKFFPSDPAARLALTELMTEMASTEEQVRWLAKRMRSLYNEWPGEREMRACFCSRFRPADGINAYSSVYSDGIPSERQNADPQRLPAGKSTPNPEIETGIRLLVVSTNMDRRLR